MTIAFRAGCPIRLVEPFSLSDSFGAKPSCLQPATWKALDGVATAPLAPPIVAVTAFGSQLVGLIENPGRSIRATIDWMRSGTPSKIWGIGSEWIVTWVDSGSISSAALTTIVPRSKGPATTGVISTAEIGAPL